MSKNVHRTKGTVEEVGLCFKQQTHSQCHAPHTYLRVQACKICEQHPGNYSPAHYLGRSPGQTSLPQPQQLTLYDMKTIKTIIDFHPNRSMLMKKACKLEFL